MKKTDLDVIRVETALSRFPMHRLAKAGAVEIVIHEQNGASDLMRWEVSHNAKFGQPGPLAYKLDTLVINRRIEAVGKPTPKLVKLGSLKEIAQELDLGGDTTLVKRALYQNAGAFITAKVRYKAVDGAKRSIEFGTTRYAVVLTGETLPDGRRADAVYVILHDLYREILDTALTRPLDYEYLRTLPPAPQRLYELLSFQMYAALKNGSQTARLTYSGFCMCAPQTRYYDREKARKQMDKIHAPHRKSGYIAGVELESTTDRESRPDWTMIYTPGPKAKAEFKAFTQRCGGPVVVEAEPTPEFMGQERELIDRGVTPSQAVELMREFPEDHIRRQIEVLDWLREQRPTQVKDPGAYLAEAIRKDHTPPVGFEGQAERAAREATTRAQEEQARQAKAREQEIRVREEVIQKQIADYWATLSSDQQEQIKAEALARATPEHKRVYENSRHSSRFRQAYLQTICQAHIRSLLKLPPQESQESPR